MIDIRLSLRNFTLIFRVHSFTTSMTVHDATNTAEHAVPHNSGSKNFASLQSDLYFNLQADYMSVSITSLAATMRKCIYSVIPKNRNCSITTQRYAITLLIIYIVYINKHSRDSIIKLCFFKISYHG